MRSFRTLGLILLTGLAAPADITASPRLPTQSSAPAPAADDPEATPDGRRVYLGRDVARTMHWRGATWLLRETREKEENGARLREWLDVRPGDAVCDLGCGNGYHTLPLAEAVGPKGTVYAVDLQVEMLDFLAERAKETGFEGLVPIEASIDDPHLPDGSCDLVLMVDVYHELSHPVRVLGHVRDALKPGGRVVLVEFRTEDRGVPIKTRHKMPKAQMIREMAANGFRLAAETDALPWQHVMAFEVQQDVDPRHEARELARGFVAAASRTDARILEPYFDARVDLAGKRETARAAALSFAETMRAGAAPLPYGTRVSLRAGTDAGLVASLAPESGATIADDLGSLTLRMDSEGRWCVSAWGPAGPAIRKHGSPRPFVAMATRAAPAGAPTGIREPNRLAMLGFDGLATVQPSTAGDRAMCESAGLDLWATYAVLDLAEPQAPALDALEATLRQLEGGPGMLWLALQHRGESGTADALAERATAALARLERAAETTGVEIALYPHTGFWLATGEQARDLAAKYERVGVCFNLCHFLKREERPDGSDLLRSVGDELFAVTLNGADVDGSTWPALIQPLGSGSYDVAPLLRTLDELGYGGPVGLQTYGLRSTPAKHLAESMAAWRALSASK